MEDFLADPQEIESRSMEIIEEILGDKSFAPGEAEIVKRIIHTTADFDFASITVVSHGALEGARRALLRGGCRMTADTQMIVSGVDRALLEEFGARLDCFVGDEETRRMAREAGITRSMANIRRAAAVNKEGFYIIGNAPTALYEVLRLAAEGHINPALVIGVPVGFVGAAESKEMLMCSSLPYVSTRGRKGGSPVAVAALHALLRSTLQRPPGGT